MYIVLVNVHVKNEYIQKFIEATIDNASNSIYEPGVVRFDFHQQQDDPTKFILIEVYRDKKDTLLHKETLHYKRWRDTVAEMMMEDRRSEKIGRAHV